MNSKDEIYSICFKYESGNDEFMINSVKWYSIDEMKKMVKQSKKDFLREINFNLYSCKESNHYLYIDDGNTAYLISGTLKRDKFNNTYNDLKKELK